MGHDHKNKKGKSSSKKSKKELDVEDPPNNNNESSCNTDIFKSRLFWGPLICIGIIGVILLIVLLPVSYNYIEYYEIGFKKNTVSNTVDISQVYGPGRYLWAPEDSVVTFPSTYQHIEFLDDDLLVFSQTGLEFNLEADIYYRLTEENLANIYQDFGTNYHDRFVEAIRASIKNTAPNFSVDEFVRNRTDITQIMFNNINNDLADLNIKIDENKFFLGRISFPDLVKNVFLNTAVQQLQNDQSLLQQQVTLIDRSTEQILASIDANITIVLQQSLAEAESIVRKSEAEAKKIFEEATGQGIGNLFAQLNVTSVSDREMIFKLFSILDNENDPQLIVGNINAIINLGSP